MSADIVINLFRQDLRLTDNPALCNAANHSKVMPVFILDETNKNARRIGSASKIWLHNSLHALNKSLDNKLMVFYGDTEKILIDLIEKYKIKAVFANRRYEASEIKLENILQKLLKSHEVDFNLFKSGLLWEPGEILKGDGKPYKVYTPFYKKCLTLPPQHKPLVKPKKLNIYSPEKTKLDDLNLIPAHNWCKKLTLDVGEKAAINRLRKFIDNGIQDYKNGRNFPAKKNVSRLSPHLHFGEISPLQVWYAVKHLESNDNTNTFLSEVVWREFSYNLIYYFPEMEKKNLQPKFDKFPWKNNKSFLKKWQQGKTGYPIVDAGMQELWQTGYMHNRVRMIVGSFLVKNLLLHWKYGEEWFWDCLVDADLANNVCSWQWVAGSGADAQPYFRVFNPITQAEKFDPNGDYIKKYLPVLAKLPAKYAYQPWEAPTEALLKAGVKLGVNYPKPIVELKLSREAALEAYNTIR